MPCQTARELLDRIEEWRQAEGQLPDFVELYGQLVRLQDEVRPRIPVPKPTLSKGAISDHLRKGIPLVRLEDLSLDWRLLKGLFQAVAKAIVDYSAVPPGDAEELQKVASDTALLREVIKAWHEGKPVPASEAGSGVGQALLNAIIQVTLHPFIALQAEALMPLVSQELWRRGYCPICGGMPDFAFLEREVGARWLLCSLCDSTWLFQRLRCPYCNNEEQTSLSYLTDEEGAYRLYLCEKCRGYLKSVDLRKKEGEVSLLWERIHTLKLDWQAQQEGFQALAGLLSIRK